MDDPEEVGRTWDERRVQSGKTKLKMIAQIESKNYRFRAGGRSLD